VLRIGAVLVPINTRFRTRDLAYVLAQSDSKVLIIHARSGPIDYLGMTREAVKLPAGDSEVSDANFPRLRRVIVLSETVHAGTVQWTGLEAAASNIPDAT